MTGPDLVALLADVWTEQIFERVYKLRGAVLGLHLNREELAPVMVLRAYPPDGDPDAPSFAFKRLDLTAYFYGAERLMRSIDRQVDGLARFLCDEQLEWKGIW